MKSLNLIFENIHYTRKKKNVIKTFPFDGKNKIFIQENLIMLIYTAPRGGIRGTESAGREFLKLQSTLFYIQIQFLIVFFYLKNKSKLYFRQQFTYKLKNTCIIPVYFLI